MQLLFNSLDSRIDEAIKTLDDLVRIPTIVPPGDNYEEVMDFISQRCKELDFQVETISMPRELFETKNPRLADLQGERVNLVAIKNVGAKKTIVINTHLDVVPADDGWIYPPFEVTVEGDHIFGRGVADSKGGVAALLTVLLAMKELGIRPKYNLVIALNTDEEVGPYSGLCYLADIGKLEADYFLSMDGYIDNITAASNGNVDWQIDVFGKSCHSGSSFLGLNAIEKSIPLLNGLMELKTQIETRRSAVPVSPAISEETGIDVLVPVLNINVINGGVKLNIVPDKCIMKGDRRFIPEESFEDVCKELNEAVNRVGKNNPDIKFRLSCNEIYPPMLTDMAHPWIKEVQCAASEVSGREVRVAGTQGSLDVAYAVKITGIPACSYGVGRRMGGMVHGNDENIRINDMIEFMKFLGRLICGNE
jgi:succinyl-diaminopimelate desuccinylase